MITICDTGPLLALANRKDPHHAWASEVIKQTRPPLLTSEAVLTEALYFVREYTLDPEVFFEMLERGALRIGFNLAESWTRVHTLMVRYSNMDLADASIVVMTEQRKRCQVLTLDRKDFSVYRRNDRQVIPFIAPR